MVMLKPRERNLMELNNMSHKLGRNLFEVLYRYGRFNNTGNFLLIDAENIEVEGCINIKSLNLAPNQVAYLLSSSGYSRYIYRDNITTRSRVTLYYLNNFILIYDIKDRLEGEVKSRSIFGEFDTDATFRLCKALRSDYTVADKVDKSGYNLSLFRNKLHKALTLNKIKNLETKDKKFIKQKQRLNKITALVKEYQSLVTFNGFLEVEKSYWRAETELVSVFGKKLNNLRNNLKYRMSHVEFHSPKSIVKYYRSSVSRIISNMKSEATWQKNGIYNTPRQIEILEELKNI